MFQAYHPRPKVTEKRQELVQTSTSTNTSFPAVLYRAVHMAAQVENVEVFLDHSIVDVSLGLTEGTLRL